jgi:hypothetical protein
MAARKGSASEEAGVEIKEARRVPLGLRTTPQLRGRLDHAAMKSGRSLAQEVEFRLELSLRDEESNRQNDRIIDALEDIIGAAGDIDTSQLLISLAKAIKQVQDAQGVNWCNHASDLNAYDINLKDMMEGIRRIKLNRERATIADYMALEHPLLLKDPPKMKD